MVSLTKPGIVGGSPTTARRSLGEHFFLGKPSTKLTGRGFLEAGLQSGIIVAQQEFASFIGKELTDAQKARFRGYADSPVAAKAGVSISAFENVSTGAVGVNVRAALFKAFRLAEQPAKQQALLHFARNPNKTSSRRHPSRYGRDLGEVASGFSYETSGRAGGKGAVTLGVKIKDGELGRKIIAQNFGLKKGTLAGAKKFKLGGGIT